MRMSSDEDHLCRKDGVERWVEKMLVSSCDILREIGTWETEKEAGDGRLGEETERKGSIRGLPREESLQNTNIWETDREGSGLWGCPYSRQLTCR